LKNIQMKHCFIKLRNNNKDRRTITRHIQIIFKDEELEEKSVCSFF